jgi:hypothetical protein
MVFADGLNLAIHHDGGMQGWPPGVEPQPGWHIVTQAEYGRMVDEMPDTVRERLIERLAADAAQSN